MTAGAASAQQPRPIDDVLTLEDTTSCLHRDALTRDIAKWLGRDAVDERLGVVVISDAIRIRFRIRRGEAVVGERVFPTTEVPCAEADATVAIAVASAIDAAERPSSAPPPELAPPPVEPPPDTTSPWAPPSSLPRPALAPPVVVLPATPRPNDRSTDSDALAHRLGLGVQGVLLLGALPTAAPAVAPAVEVALTDIFDIRGSALIVGEQEADIRNAEDLAVGSARVGMAGGRLDGCAGIGIGRGGHRVRGCGGVLVASIRADGTSSSVSPGSGRAAWVAPVLRADAEIHVVSAFGFSVAADLFVPVVTAELQIERASGSPVSRSLPQVGGALSVGPYLHF